VIGKEAAEKLMAVKPHAGMSRGGTGARIRVISGLDLKVGGSGMKGFYDQILPAFVNKWAKPFGVRVGETKIRNKQSLEIRRATDDGADEYPWYIYDPITEDHWTGESGIEQWFATKAKAEAELKGMGQAGGLSVHGIDITDQMRDTALEGLPLFAKKPKS